MKKTITWILIADNGHARTVENDGPGHGIRPLDDMTFDSLGKREGELWADQPGRSFDSAGQHRHAMEPSTDATETEARKFFQLVAGKLEDARKAGRFDRLILVAPPHALGLLRKTLPDDLGARVTAELAKDLVKIPQIELPKHLGEVLPV